MLGGPGKLRQAVADAGQSIRTAAEGTGKLVLAALVTAAAALLAALAALVLVWRMRKTAVA